MKLELIGIPMVTMRAEMVGKKGRSMLNLN